MLTIDGASNSPIAPHLFKIALLTKFVLRTRKTLSLRTLQTWTPRPSSPTTPIRAASMTSRDSRSPLLCLCSMSAQT